MHFDYSLMIVTIGLAMVGVLMVYSATKGLLTSKGLNPKYYLERQALWVVLGTVAMLVTIFVDYRHIRRLAYVIYGGVVLGLVGVLSPFGHSALGAQRWFQLGPLQFQHLAASRQEPSGVQQARGRRRVFSARCSPLRRQGKKQP